MLVAGYLLVPRWQAVRQEQQRLMTPADELAGLQQKIQADPQNGALWALLGEYYLWRNAYGPALQAYRQALNTGEAPAQYYAALATVLYYQAGQQMTPAARTMLNRALELDPQEVTALMLQASSAFMQADYPQAIVLWQQILDTHSARINSRQIVDAINMARLMSTAQPAQSRTD
ncbi:heme lyase NrfEFG subunit NrfG [Shimwellia blattae]|nr:heme lyase NrfEFG subunit NrfG [Shimwellia blattae]